MLVTAAIPTRDAYGFGCKSNDGVYWYSNRDGTWIEANTPLVGDNSHVTQGMRDTLDRMAFTYTYDDRAYFKKNHPKENKVTTGNTLDGMTAEQLRDLAQRASTAAMKQEAEAAKKAQAEKDRKDIIPGVGETWKYDGRLFTTFAKPHNVLVSCNEKGKDFRWVNHWGKFSSIFGGDTIGHKIDDLTKDECGGQHQLYASMRDAVGRLALIAAGQMSLDA